MADISEAVLARRQKDLEGFTEYYQERLDKMVGKHAKDLKPAWERMAKNLERKVEKLYKDAGAIDDPAKVKALLAKAGSMERLKAQLDRDLNINGLLKDQAEKSQPFFTGALSNAFEDGYYFNSFGLEQAARVSVSVPLLTKANVLGVIANPWLPDGANYSSRIRANAAYVAEKARETVAQAVANGWSVNEAARTMRAVTGEGYFRNVTLMRTELNRAASLGSSYLFMENADILDGKRWNATLDSRTAPKDAANDGEIFDLDYDTPVNKGVPGKRIPNHPNCRCKYSPVLSALGVSNRERIAREGDGPGSWGRNTYTKARTYREYAKQRGLPDLDERLEKDRLTQYLRPGETIADLNKKVVRWVTTGGTVSVGKPLWEEVKEVKNLEMLTEKYGVKFTADADVVLDGRVYEYLDATIQNINSKLPNGYSFDKLADEVNFRRYGVRSNQTGSSVNRIITLNSNVLDNTEEGFESILDSLQSKYKSYVYNYHPKTLNPLSTLTHETGHLLHDQILVNTKGINPTKSLIKKQNDAIRKEVLGAFNLTAHNKDAYTVTTMLSEYATENSTEFFAEAFVEIMDNPNPRPMAIKFWEVLQKYM